MIITTTLNRIREHRPCGEGWSKLLAGLGKAKADDEPLPFARIVEINDIGDALWCCRAEPQYDREWRLFAVWCARQVQHLMTDHRSIAALDVAERHAKGEATDADLEAARASAEVAALDVSRAAAWAAARASDEAAVRTAAEVVAGSAAWAATRAYAGDAAWAAAGSAAWAAARAYAGDAAWAAAVTTARDAQTSEFLRIVGQEKQG